MFMFPEPYRRHLRTSNMVERLNKEPELGTLEIPVQEPPPFLPRRNRRLPPVSRKRWRAASRSC